MANSLSSKVESTFVINFDVAQFEAFDIDRVLESGFMNCDGFEFKIVITNEIRKQQETFTVELQARSLEGRTYFVYYGVVMWNPKSGKIIENKTAFNNKSLTAFNSMNFITEKTLSGKTYVNKGILGVSVTVRMTHNKITENLDVVKPSTIPGIDWNKTLPLALECSNTSDLIFKTHPGEIRAHKLILSLVSPVFKAMFENQMQESVSNEIVISDFSEEVVRSFLKCIYDESTIRSELETHAEQLLLIANKYEVSVIADCASKFIIDRLCMDNVVDILLFGDKLGRKDIKLAAMNVMGKKSAYFWKDKDVNDKLGIPLMDEFYRHLTGDYTFDRCAKRQKT